METDKRLKSAADQKQNTPGEIFTEYVIAIPNQELGCFFITEGSSQLLSGPFRHGMISHVEVNDLSSVM